MKRAHWRNTPEEYDKRWLARIQATTVTAPNGCVLWTGYVHPLFGYGATGYRGKTVHVHRAFYQVSRGVKLSRWELVCHSCDTPNCINLDHLWIGSYSDNNTDAARKKRHHRSRVTHCDHGHPFDEVNTFTTKDGRRHCKTCQRIRQRIRAGWPEELARSVSVVPKGQRPVDAPWSARKQS
jgi:hypothetical protein